MSGSGDRAEGGLGHSVSLGHEHLWEGICIAGSLWRVKKAFRGIKKAM